MPNILYIASHLSLATAHRYPPFHSWDNRGTQRAINSCNIATSWVVKPGRDSSLTPPLSMTVCSINICGRTMAWPREEKLTGREKKGKEGQLSLEDNLESDILQKKKKTSPKFHSREQVCSHVSRGKKKVGDTSLKRCKVRGPSRSAAPLQLPGRNRSRITSGGHGGSWWPSDTRWNCFLTFSLTPSSSRIWVQIYKAVFENRSHLSPDGRPYLRMEVRGHDLLFSADFFPLSSSGQQTPGKNPGRDGEGGQVWEQKRIDSPFGKKKTLAHWAGQGRGQQ